MNLVCNIIFIITTIFIIIYDYKYQKIPFELILLNYISLCFLTNLYLLIGLIIIFIIKKINKPIDIVYLFILCYLIINIHTNYSLISIMILLIYTLCSKSSKISFMVPLELALLFEIYILSFLI